MQNVAPMGSVDAIHTNNFSRICIIKIHNTNYVGKKKILLFEKECHLSMLKFYNFEHMVWLLQEAEPLGFQFGVRIIHTVNTGIPVRTVYHWKP